MASSSERPDLAAFAELQHLVRSLTEELAGFRRRALQAETRLKETERVTSSGGVSSARVVALEKENRVLRERLEAATTKVRAVLDRVRFVRQQHGGAGPADR